MKILYVLSLTLLLYCTTTLALQDSLLLKLLAPLFRLRKIAVTVAKPLKLFQERTDALRQFFSLFDHKIGAAK
jgi:hypothetical protein